MGFNKKFFTTGGIVASSPAAAGTNYIDMDITYQLYRSQTTPSNSSAYTFSFWINFNTLDWSANNQVLIATGAYPSVAREEVFNSGTTGKWTHNFDAGASAQGSYTQDSAMSISTGQWYHYVIAKNAGSAPTYYLNATPYFFSGSVGADTGSTRINSGSHFHYLFRPQWGGSSGVDAKVAYLQFVDGSALSAGFFYNTNGSNLTPKEYTGSFGNNGWKILMGDTSDILNDTSGNNNDLTLSGTLSYGSDTIITS